MATLDYDTDCGIVPTTNEWSLVSNTQILISPLSGALQTVELPGARWVATLSFSDMEPEESRVLIGFLARLRGSAGRFTLYDHSLAAARGEVSGAATVINIGGNNDATTVSGDETFTTVDTDFTADSVGDYVEVTSGADIGIYKIITYNSTTSVELDTAMTASDTVDYQIWPSKDRIEVSNTQSDTTVIFNPGDYIEVNGELKIVTQDATITSNQTTVYVEPPFRTLVSNSITKTVTYTSPTATFALQDDNQTKWSNRETAFLSNMSFSCVEVF